jgi:hypothetical protein
MPKGNPAGYLPHMKGKSKKMAKKRGAKKSMAHGQFAEMMKGKDKPKR